MTGHLRIKSPNTQLGVLLVAYFVPQLILAYVVVGVLGEKPDLANPENLSMMKLIQAVSSVLFFFLPAWIFARFSFTGKYLYFLGFRKPERASMYLLGVGCMLIAFPMVFWLGELNQRIPLPASLIEMEKQAAGQMEAFLKINGPMDLFVNIIVIALLPAICEEVFFRGAMQRVIIHLTRNAWVGIVVAAALFSAFHFQFQGFLPRMFLGIVLGALYWYSGSLWTSILAHFVTNAVQVVVASYATKYINENPQVPIYLALISAVAVFAILRMYRQLSTATWSKVYNRDGITPFNDFLAK